MAILKHFSEQSYGKDHLLIDQFQIKTLSELFTKCAEIWKEDRDAILIFYMDQTSHGTILTMEDV